MKSKKELGKVDNQMEFENMVIKSICFCIAQYHNSSSLTGLLKDC